MRFSLRVQVKIFAVLSIFLFAMACYYGFRGEEAANAAQSCAYTFTDASGASMGVYRDPSYTIRVCQDAALSAYTTYYVQINSPTVADGGSVDYLHIHDSVDTQVNFGDGSDTRALTLQPGGPPYVWRTSFTTPTAAGVYGLESRIMNGSQTSQVHINGWKATVGYPAAYVRTYTDGTYSQTIDSYSAGAVVYAEIYDPIFLDDVPSESNSTITLGDFSGGSVSVAPTLSNPEPKKFRIEFALPGTGGDKYVSMAIRNSASTLLADPRTLIRIDSSAPVVSNIRPSGISSSTSPVIGASISDGSGSGIDPSSAVIFVHGSLRSNCTISTYAISCPATPLDEGLHTIDISIRDYAGNIGTGTGTFMTDYSSPSVVNIQPSGNITSTSATVSAYLYDSASGIDVSSSSVEVDGVTISGCERTASNISCPVSGLAQGAHAISVNVWDIAGHAGSGSGSFTVNSDPVPPLIENIQPFGTITSTTASISAYFSDNSSGINAASATAYLDGLALSQCSRTAATISCAVSGLAQGAHSVSVSVKDNYGNTGTGTGGFDVESIAPSVSISLPADTIETTTATIAATYADGGSGVDTGTVSVDVDGVPLSVCYVHADAVYCSVSGLALGTHSINASVRDNAGNSGTASRGFTVVEPATPDVTAPTIGGISPAGGFTSGSIDVSAGFSDTGSGIDVGSATVSLDGVTLAGCAVDTVSIHCHVDGLADGPHEILASIADNAGNGSSSSSSFTGDVTAPIISNIQPSGWITLASDTITADFSDGSGSGIDPATVTVMVNGATRTNCTVVSANGVSCPRQASPYSIDFTHAVTITAADYAGNVSTGSGAFRLDERGPHISILPSNRQVLDTNSPVVSVNLGDDGGFFDVTGSGVASVEVYVEGAGILSCAATDPNNTHFDCPATGLSEGSHAVNISAWDVAGNLSTFDSVFCVDTLAPAVTDFLPSGTIATTAPIISASYSDYGTGINLSTVNVSYDGYALSHCSSSATSISCPMMGLTQGNHTASISVTDNHNRTTSVSQAFTISTLAPSVTSISPAGFINNSAPLIHASYTDSGTGVDAGSVIVSLDGAALSGCTATVTDVSCQASGLAHGPHSINVSVSDNWGNTDSAAVDTYVDLEKPVLTLIERALSIGWNQFDAFYTDYDSKIDPLSQTVTIDGVALDGCWQRMATSAYGYLTCYRPTVSDGVHSVTIGISDYAGNVSTATRSLMFDKVAPSITAIRPSGASTTAPTISVSYDDGTSGIRPNGAFVSLDGTEMSCTVTTSEATCPVTGLAPGQHTIRAAVADNAGNVTTASSTFTASIPARPALGISLQRAYWASYADFQARELSLSWSVNNGGPEAAIGLTVIGSSNTNGVTMTTSAPMAMGDIASAGSAVADLKYHVPTGVSSFKATVYATARDALDNAYDYPGPYPGA